MTLSFSSKNKKHLVSSGFDLEAFLCGHLAVEGCGGGVFSFGNFLALFFDNDLDVSWVGHVWVNTTVGTVRASALLHSLVNLDVLDDALVGIETLELGVGNNVDKEGLEVCACFDWPSNLTSWCVQVLALCVTAATTGETLEWNSLLACQDVIDVLLRCFHFLTPESMANLTHVLEVNTEGGCLGFGDLGAIVGVAAGGVEG